MSSITEVREAETQRLFATVDAFAEELKERLHQKVQEGYGGWDDPEWLAGCTRRILEEAEALPLEATDAVTVRRCIDLAAFTMFRWHFGRTAAQERNDEARP